MDSFEDLGLSPELIEALAAEGIERPTPIQESTMPILRRGNNLVMAAGPGSGVSTGWVVGMLDRIPAEGDSPRILALTATSDSAARLAESIGRLAISTGHTVAALGSPWVLPERAQVLLGTPADVLAAASAGRISLAALEALVVDQAQNIETFGGLEVVEKVLDFCPLEAQRVVTALPISAGVADLIERHLKRAITVPTDVALSNDTVKRGTVRFRIVSEPREEGTLDVVADVLADDARHVLLFCRSEDRAADVGDYLTLHGFMAGAPGDDDAPVWLGVDALQARAACAGKEGVVVVSCDVPADPDTLDRRHAISENGVTIVVAREVAHMRDLAKRTGYGVVPFPPARHALDAGAGIRETIERAMQDEDTGPYLLALEPLFERYDAAEVAAAAVALLRKKVPAAAAITSNSNTQAAPKASSSGAAPAWAKLFLSVGERDGVKAGDLLGAIIGEADVPGESVGRIDIKESHTLVEVHDAVAQKVIKSLNGTTIKGRSIRADFDRPKRPAAGARGPGGARPGTGSSGPRGGSGGARGGSGGGRRPPPRD